MERKVGEIFTYEGKTYKVIQNNELCIGCAFKGNISCKANKSITGECSKYCRSNNTDVVFKEIKDMKIKNNQLTIDIPEGMEIDLKNSNLANGIVKFKKKEITYENVEDALKLGKNCKSIIINESNASKLVALSKLMNIAKYYNGDWKPNWSSPEEYKYYIMYDSGTYKVYYSWMSIYNNIYFKNKKDVQAVIDNPNFRSILDDIYKN